MAEFGLTTTGFNPMQQDDIVDDMQADFKSEFGANINLGSGSVFGTVIGIVSERLALLWQLDEAVYDSQYPTGSEGTSVDNILALNNLKRLSASPTKTAPDPLEQDNGVTLYGLVLYGTPGTVIPVDSTIQTTASPPLSFFLDAQVTIEASVDAVQSVFFGNTPDVGAFQLSIEDPAGNTLTLPSWSYTVLAASTLLVFGGLPAGASHFGLTVTIAGSALTTANISTAGAYPTSAAIQSALRALTGYSGITASGAAGSYSITWGAIPNPLLTVANNTTTQTITPTDSVQAGVNNAHDVTAANYPYTDVVVSGAFNTGFVFTFGSGTAVGSNPASGDQPQANMEIVANTLQMGSTVTNINVSQTTVGQPAQGVGSATCTEDGPNFVAADTLTVIGSAVSGWASVTNQLDCVEGTNDEDDTEAMQRRSTLLSSQANGPIQSIVEKVLQVTDVSAAIGFVNLTGAALQVFSFNSVPGSGHYAVSINGQTTSNLNFGSTAATVQTAFRLLTGYSTVLVTGSEQYGFTFDFNGSYGGQAQPLATVVNNTTGVAAAIAFGRPPNSFEIVVEGGLASDIAEAIYGAMPTGIKSYGSTHTQIQDAFDNPVTISFSRPTQVLFYVTITLVTDYYNTPGDSGSGLNPKAKWSPQSVQTIQLDVIDIGNATTIGGTVIGFGSDGLIGAFNSVEGIISYTMFFGTSASPVANANIALLAQQQAVFEQFNCVVSWT